MKYIFLTLLIPFIVLLATNSHALIPGATSCDSTRSWLVRTCNKSPVSQRCELRYRRYAKNCIPQSVCFEVYAPVCGINPLQKAKTYGNDCQRVVDAARKVKPGTCKISIKK